MKIKCPNCKEWIDDASDTCSLCGANLYPLNSCHSDEDNPDLKAFVKQSRDVRIRNIWIASLVGVALVTFVLGIVIQLITPAIIAASVLWFMIYAFIDYWGDKKILAVNNEIPPEIRRFKIKWFIPNGILAIILVLNYFYFGSSLPEWLDHLLDYLYWNIDILRRFGIIPLLIIALILLMGMMFYHSIKMRIADKTIKKKMLKE